MTNQNGNGNNGNGNIMAAFRAMLEDRCRQLVESDDPLALLAEWEATRTEESKHEQESSGRVRTRINGRTVGPG